MKIKLKNILFISVLSFFIFSCESLVEDLNDNPNRQTSSTYDLVLSGTQLGNMVLQTGEMTRKTGIFSGQYTGIDRSHLLYNNYNVTASTFNAEWNNVYADVIVNSRVAEQIAIDNNIGGITLGIVKVVRASAFGTAASLWGDIPYDESGVPEIENPAFENQIDVYNKIQLLLDEAISDLSSGIGRPSQGADLHFDGTSTDADAGDLPDTAGEEVADDIFYQWSLITGAAAGFTYVDLNDNGLYDFGEPIFNVGGEEIYYETNYGDAIADGPDPEDLGTSALQSLQLPADVYILNLHIEDNYGDSDFVSYVIGVSAERNAVPTSDAGIDQEWYMNYEEDYKDIETSIYANQKGGFDAEVKCEKRPDLNTGLQSFPDEATADHWARMHAERMMRMMLSSK